MKKRILYNILNEWRDEDDDSPIDIDDIDLEPTSSNMDNEPDLGDDDFVLSTNVNTNTFFDDLVKFINNDLFLEDYHVKKDNISIQGVFVKYTQKIPLNEHTSKTPDFILNKIREFIEKSHYKKTQTEDNGLFYHSIDEYIQVHKIYKPWICWEYANVSSWKNKYIERDKDWKTPLSTPIQMGEVFNFQFFFIHELKSQRTRFESIKVYIDCEIKGVVVYDGVLCYDRKIKPSINLVVLYALNDYSLPNKKMQLTLISDVVDEYTEDEVKDVFMNNEPLKLKL